MTSHSAATSSQRRNCDACDAAGTVRRSIRTERFDYGERGSTVTLSVRVPTWTCAGCHTAYTEGDAEDARHEAVCHHLGVLTPREIRDIRARHGLTQAEFARLTRFGEATIKRWESGLLIQNASADQYLRLLREPSGFALLRKLTAKTRPPPGSPSRPSGPA